MQKLAVVVLAFVLALANCEKKQTTSTQTSQPRSWPGTMALTWQPSPPVSDKDVTFALRLTNASGDPVDGASVTANLIMPSMDMGKNEVKLTDQGNGEYRGTGKFSMAGPWNVVVSSKAGSVTGQQTYPVVVHRE
jgi:nitrogen fixation protein FixH